MALFGCDNDTQMLSILGGVALQCIGGTFGIIQITLVVIHLNLAHNFLYFLLRNAPARHAASGMFGKKIRSLRIAKNIEVVFAIGFDFRLLIGYRFCFQRRCFLIAATLHEKRQDKKYQQEKIRNSFFHCIETTYWLRSFMSRRQITMKKLIMQKAGKRYDERKLANAMQQAVVKPGIKSQATIGTLE